MGCFSNLIEVDEMEAQKFLACNAHCPDGKNIFIENQIDPTIIGGFILKINDMQYDASILNKLRILNTKLLKTNSV